MKTSDMISLAVTILCVTAVGCSSTPPTKGVGAAAPTTQQEVADQARDARTQSYALTEMADRRDLEADVLAKELGPDHPSVEKKRRLAEELRAAAKEADTNARSLRRDVPHGMVQ